jgi:hypothetical protein
LPTLSLASGQATGPLLELSVEVAADEREGGRDRQIG